MARKFDRLVESVMSEAKSKKWKAKKASMKSHSYLSKDIVKRLIDDDTDITYIPIDSFHEPITESMSEIIRQVKNTIKDSYHNRPFDDDRAWIPSMMTRSDVEKFKVEKEYMDFDEYVDVDDFENKFADYQKAYESALNDPSEQNIDKLLSEFEWIGFKYDPPTKMIPWMFTMDELEKIVKTLI